MTRHLFQIDREWVVRRDALLRAQEDAAIRDARDRANREERVTLDELLELRARNAREEKG